MCECYQIGGRFIAEDPSCPAHGLWAIREREESESYVADLEKKIANLEAENKLLLSKIASLKDSVARWSQKARRVGHQSG